MILTVVHLHAAQHIEGPSNPKASMHRVLLVLAACVCLSVLHGGRAECGPTAAPVRPLRVVTINLYHGGPFSGYWGDGRQLDRRLEMVARELRGLAPDIIGLQEASETRQRGNAAARLAAQLGLHYVYAAANPRPFKSDRINRLIASFLNFSEGPAIVSRFPIVAWESLDLPRCRAYADSRLLLHARLQSPGGALDVFSTHTLGDPCQNGRVAQLVRNRRGPLPAVLMGDFNASEDSAAIGAITRIGGFTDAFRTVNPSLPGPTVRQPIDAPFSMVRRRADYVFVCPGEEYGGQVLSSRVVLNTPQQLPDGGTLWPSDHYGVLAELKLFPPNGHP